MQEQADEKKKEKERCRRGWKITAAFQKLNQEGKVFKKWEKFVEKYEIYIKKGVYK
ncbi:MAG: hypothetical protein NC302_12100 [Bacteroidales bacterium]|nr:hypothetical protein [Bacteroidales bacterium]MCM1415902.1 hypothetical protein [bacterium]MCM1423535.1 hypothetical protein [bacterium]